MSALTISCGSPPQGVVGKFYTYTIPTSGGTSPYTFSVILPVYVVLETNGVKNATQNKLNLVAGTNITLSDDGSGNVTITSSGGGGGGGAIVQIAQTVLAVDTVTISFSPIPATYTDLILVVTGRTDESVVLSSIYLQFNGDTGANYFRQLLDGVNSTATAFAQVSTAKLEFGPMSGASASAGLSGSFECKIFGYANTTFKKNTHTVCAARTGAGGANLFNVTDANWWDNTTAINSILVGIVTVGANMKAGTIVTLYGRK